MKLQVYILKYQLKILQCLNHLIRVETFWNQNETFSFTLNVNANGLSDPCFASQSSSLIYLVMGNESSLRKALPRFMQVFPCG